MGILKELKLEDESKEYRRELTKQLSMWMKEIRKSKMPEVFMLWINDNGGYEFGFFGERTSTEELVGMLEWAKFYFQYTEMEE